MSVYYFWKGNINIHFTHSFYIPKTISFKIDFLLKLNSCQENLIPVNLQVFRSFRLPVERQIKKMFNDQNRSNLFKKNVFVSKLKKKKIITICSGITNNYPTQCYSHTILHIHLTFRETGRIICIDSNHRRW